RIPVIVMSKQYRVSLPASRTELAQLLTRLQDDALQEPDRQLLMRLVQQLLVSATPAANGPKSGSTTSLPETPRPETETKAPGHGRRSASDYPGARRVRCTDPQWHAGDRC